MLCKNWKCVLLLLALLVTTVANAAPTMSYCNTDFVARALPTSSDAYASSIPQTSQIAEPCNSHLAGVAAEFLKPPVGFIDSPTSLPANAKFLPATPGALLMALTGFLCVSLVRDRRVWLAVLAGLLWAGQTGIQALPHLAVHISHGKHIERKSSVKPVCLHQLENSHRLRSDIGGTQYIGLLHHLAGIPDDQSAFANRHLIKSITLSQHRKNLYTKVFNYFHKNTYTSQSAIIVERYNLPLFNCLALRAKQTAFYSPTFTFAQLARGPPRLS